MRILLLILLAVFALPAMAQDVTMPDRYEVRDVKVNITTENPAAARDVGLMEATRQAYAQLKERLATEGEILPTLDDNGMAAAVQDFSIDGEKVSAKRYIGSFTIRFRPTVASAAPITGEYGQMAGEGMRDIPVTFAFNQLGEWVTGRNALRNVNGVRAMQIVGLRRNYVDATIRFAGDPAMFGQMATAQGLTAIPPSAVNPRWTLQLQQ
jgi:hypothetical protein